MVTCRRGCPKQHISSLCANGVSYCSGRVLDKPKTKSKAFNVRAFLDAAGTARKIAQFQRKQTIFSQGDDSKHVMYIQKGGVKLSVVNELGKEPVVAILGPGDFFGEGGLSGQPLRIGTATAITPTTLLIIEKKEMIRVLHSEHEFSDRFISHMLSRNLRTEQDLIDQLFNSSEKRWPVLFCCSPAMAYKINLPPRFQRYPRKCSRK